MSETVEKLVVLVAQLQRELAEAEAYIGDLESALAEAGPALTLQKIRSGIVGEQVCPVCEGRGHTYELRRVFHMAAPPTDEPVERECPSCRGTGKPGKTLMEIFAREERMKSEERVPPKRARSSLRREYHYRCRGCQLLDLRPETAELVKMAEERVLVEGRSARSTAYLLAPQFASLNLNPLTSRSISNHLQHVELIGEEKRPGLKTKLAGSEHST